MDRRRLRSATHVYPTTDSPSAMGAKGPRRHWAIETGSRGTGPPIKRHEQPRAPPRQSARGEPPLESAPEWGTLHFTIHNTARPSRRLQDIALQRHNRSIPNLGRAHKRGISKWWFRRGKDLTAPSNRTTATCHFLAWLRRRTKVVSKVVVMVDLSRRI